MNHFSEFKEKELKLILNVRANEEKLGEKVLLGEQGLVKAKFVLLGIKDDVGVKANCGIPGTSTAWDYFLKSFVNIQNTMQLKGDDLAIYGSFDFAELATSNDLNVLRKNVEIIDSEVSEVIKKLTTSNKIPIVIGGGHNNCYPIIKGICEASRKREADFKLSVINLDAHSDFRIKEGRHSGNGFRYAMEDGYLEKYAVIGLHKNYNSQNVIDELSKNKKVRISFFEDIILKEKTTFKEEINSSIKFLDSNQIGVELDLDSIENILSSAYTPSGLSLLEARKYIYLVKEKASYLHICEGAATLNERNDSYLGKAISFLVSDFLRAD